MKKLLILFLVLPIALSSIAQMQDPEAKEILDKVSAKIADNKTIRVDFNLTISDRVEDITSSSSGTLTIKGEKYKVVSPGSKIIFDGTTMWSYNEEINEVNITEPDPDNEDFVENPKLIFSFYNRDFKCRYDGVVNIDGIDVDEVELFPIKLEQPYSRIIIYVNKKDNSIAKIKSVGKEGVDYSIELTNQKTDLPIEDSEFTFNEKNYKDLEVIDLR